VLISLERDGTLGHLEFDKEGDVLFTELVPLKIEKGEFVVWENKRRG